MTHLISELDAGVLDSRVYFAVPFVERESAKKLGGQWDTAKGAWYVPQGADLAKFARWRRIEGSRPQRVLERV